MKPKHTLTEATGSSDMLLISLTIEECTASGEFREHLLVLGTNFVTDILGRDFTLPLYSGPFQGQFPLSPEQFLSLYNRFHKLG